MSNAVNASKHIIPGHKENGIHTIYKQLIFIYVIIGKCQRFSRQQSLIKSHEQDEKVVIIANIFFNFYFVSCEKQI